MGGDWKIYGWMVSCGNFWKNFEKWRHWSRHFAKVSQAVVKWDPIWGEQTLQMYGNVQGFPYNNALFGLVI